MVVPSPDAVFSHFLLFTKAVAEGSVVFAVNSSISACRFTPQKVLSTHEDINLNNLSMSVTCFPRLLCSQGGFLIQCPVFIMSLMSSGKETELRAVIFHLNYKHEPKYICTNLCSLLLVLLCVC